jgi:hypothetical protein
MKKITNKKKVTYQIKMHAMKPIYYGLKTFKNVNSFLLHILSQRPIAFNPELGKLAGSASARIQQCRINGTFAPIF